MRGGEKALEVLCERFPERSCSPSCTFADRCRRRSSASRIHQPAPALPSSVAYYRQCLPLFPAARRTVRFRPLRPRAERQPLLRQVGDRPGRRASHLLLPDADAVRLGPIRRLFRTRPGSAPCAQRRDAPRDGAPGAVGPRHRRPGRPLCRQSRTMLRTGSAGTIIAKRLWCIRPSTPTSSDRTPRGPEPFAWSCPRWCRTSASTSRSRGAGRAAFR